VDEKFLMLYALIRLQLVRGKTLIFVNSIDMVCVCEW
jgi:superfamily II DNA/RNA helicase